MESAKHVTHVLILLTVLSGCGSDTTTTVAPSPLSVAPAPAPASAGPMPGSIAISALIPSPGATLTMRRCPWPEAYGHPWNCSDAKVTAEIEVNQPLPDAVVTASYYRGTERCGIAYAGGPTVLAASVSTTFTTNLIEMSDEDVSLHCEPLPAKSTRLVVQVWSAKQPSTPLLTREFAYSYTFVNP